VDRADRREDRLRDQRRRLEDPLVVAADARPGRGEAGRDEARRGDREDEDTAVIPLPGVTAWPDQLRLLVVPPCVGGT
jgi:hypothetical protein